MFGVCERVCVCLSSAGTKEGQAPDVGVQSGSEELALQGVSHHTQRVPHDTLHVQLQHREREIQMERGIETERYRERDIQMERGIETERYRERGIERERGRSVPCCRSGAGCLLCWPRPDLCS